MERKVGMKVVLVLNRSGMFIRSRGLIDSASTELESPPDLKKAWEIIEKESGVKSLREYIECIDRACKCCPDDVVRNNIQGLVSECMKLNEDVFDAK